MIVALSARLFRRDGFHATSMSGIADVTGLNKGTLYYHFRSKADLLFAVYQTAIGELNRRVSDIDWQQPADELLLDHYRAVLSTIQTLPDVNAVYFQERPWIRRSLSPEQADAIRRHEMEFGQRIADIVAHGVATGAFRPVDPQVLSTQLLSTAQSFHRWPAAMARAGADAIAEACLQQLLDGIQAPGVGYATTPTR